MNNYPKSMIRKTSGSFVVLKHSTLENYSLSSENKLQGREEKIRATFSPRVHDGELVRQPKGFWTLCDTEVLEKSPYLKRSLDLLMYFLLKPELNDHRLWAFCANWAGLTGLHVMGLSPEQWIGVEERITWSFCFPPLVDHTGAHEWTGNKMPKLPFCPHKTVIYHN